jgi:hypothetical protein
MKVDLPLKEMTVAEKIRAMEMLWADLSKAVPDEVVPHWHATVLAEREARLAAGLEKKIPWEQAKAELRRRINEHNNS